MAKKAELLEEAKKLNLDVTSKNTIAEIEAAIKKGASNGDIQESSTTEVQADSQAEEVKVAKAGKRSTKAIKEAEEKEAKEERKAGLAESESEEAKKPFKNPTRSKLERAGKKYQEAAKLIEKEKEYSIKDALDLATKTSPVKFDATVELHINLNVDPRQADQNIRDNLVLPNGTGKTVRVAVLSEEDDAKAALKAGADIAGREELLKEIEKGNIEFDILISTPSLMAKLGKHARTLGPKGLMPNPKSGTVTTDVAKAVQQSKAGRVEYRVDSTGIVHLGVGKISFGADKLLDNVQAIFVSIKGNKPSSIKGNYVKGITVSSTMGPGIKVLTTEI